MRAALPMVAIFAVLAAGCASRGSVRQIRSELDVLRSDVGTLGQAHDKHARDTARALADLKGIEAHVQDLATAMGAAAEATRRLTARLAEVEGAVERVRAQLVPRPVPAPPAARAQPAEQPRERSQAAAARSRAPEAAYAVALAAFRSREHGQAVLEFLDFLAKYPKHRLAVNAQYWIGEAYYAQRDYRQALIEFRKVLDAPSPNGKAADALLKVGLCYARLREPTRAHQAWQRVVREHPRSEAASKARHLLDSR